MDENQESTRRFVEEAISVTQRLAAMTGRPSAPERPVILRDSEITYQALLQRRRSLVLSPMSEWSVDLLLDGISTRLRILTESTGASHCDSAPDPLDEKRTA